jgi:gluconolactonase
MANSTFEKLTGANPAPERTATGFRFTEGPVFSRLGYLLFSDPPSSKIMKWQDGKVSVFREKSNGAGSLTFDHQGRLLACEQGRVTRTEKNGAVTVLADRCETVPLNHPNDLVYAIDGNIYFTDGNQEASVLCRIDRKGKLHTASRDCRMAHGVALAPNQQKLYVADTAAANIRVYDISGDGSLKNGRLFAEARSHGLKTDEEGNVWATDGDAITVFDPRGTKLGSIAMPETPSNCAWGEGFRGLYVTAGSSIYILRANVNGTRTY